MNSPPFAGRLVTMRPVRIEDAGDAHVILSDAAAMIWWSSPPHERIAETVASLERRITSPDWYFWAITLPGEDRLIGTLGATEKRQGGVFEIGYALARAHWGHGYAADAVAALVAWLFAQGARRVFADTDPDNAASNRLLERLGFTCEGRLRGEWETHIGVRDSLIWGLLASDPRPAA